jgi:dipeptidase E
MAQDAQALGGGSVRLLLLSNSRGTDGVFLGWPRSEIMEFLGKGVRKVLFVPYASVPGTRESYDGYARKAREAFKGMGYGLDSIHEAADAAAAVSAAQAIIVGGGNTFHLLCETYAHGVLESISRRVRAGAPFVGWSAGSNLACPGIWTTNDMPIIAPPKMQALGLVPFQINPHFTDALPAGHRGERRSERIAEFLALNPRITVVGLREGALLRVENGRTQLVGAGARVFRAGLEPYDVGHGAELTLPG